jgi:hypothetical protein
VPATLSNRLSARVGPQAENTPRLLRETGGRQGVLSGAHRPLDTDQDRPAHPPPASVVIRASRAATPKRGCSPEPGRSDWPDTDGGECRAKARRAAATATVRPSIGAGSRTSLAQPERQILVGGQHEAACRRVVWLHLAEIQAAASSTLASGSAGVTQVWASPLSLWESWRLLSTSRAWRWHRRRQRVGVKVATGG